MHTYNDAFYELKKKLQPLYDEGEAAAVAHLFLEFVTGLSKADRLLRKDSMMSERQQELYDAKSIELTKGKPIQYITNNAYFMGRDYLANENVLIPRPETEELVQWVIDDVVGLKSAVAYPDATNIEGPQRLRVLDIGSGSGCIGLSLARLVPGAIVTCADVSKEAIEVLKTNIEWVFTAAEKKKGIDNITIKTLDFLDEAQRNKQLGRYEVIVSNPPYIPVSEKKNMHKNVKDFEPSVALFVPNDDALVFYKAIAAFGKGHLSDNGYIFCELDAAHAEECKALFEEQGYKDVEIKKDMHGNWRMLKCGQMKNS